MKKLTLLLLVLVLVVSIVGCTAKPADEPKSGYTDGVHTGLSKANRTGYVEATVTVEKGKITNVEMKEFRGDGSQKTKETYNYEPWHTAVDQLPAAVVEKQSADVDNVTGATSTVNKFKQAVNIALGLEPSAAGPFKNGTYEAESDKNARGGYVAVKLYVFNGTITRVDFNEFNPDGTVKSKDNYTFEPWLEAFDKLPAAVVEKQSADIDVITGATSSSNMFKQAVERAIEQAK